MKGGYAFWTAVASYLISLILLWVVGAEEAILAAISITGGFITYAILKK